MTRPHMHIHIKSRVDGWSVWLTDDDRPGDHTIYVGCWPDWNQALKAGWFAYDCVMQPRRWFTTAR